MGKIPFQKNLIKLLENQTLSRVALRARINKSTLHGYLNGIEPKGLAGLIRLAQALDVAPEDLIFKDVRNRSSTLEGSVSEHRFELTILITPKEAP